ncbi:probable cytochrome P450 4aa1 isoform X2 [Coccinella septempunctata]|uniref:probable cytochrome P450 4aa1 isoform X2 n=1 Tax=Coccinella septempunctata TaxID=41139 RepID=UPI001D08B3E0|nr:probable cytochrome P450 4aa1 isoform X2 [Coccinella septempunctata]
MTSSSHEFFFNTIYLLCLLYLLWRLRNYFRAVFLAFNLPGPHAHPLIGNALTVRDNRKLEYYGNNAHKLFGPIFRSWISIVPFFFVTDPAHLQTLLSNGRLTKKNMFYTLLHNFIGEGLITNNGEKWKLHRKLIQPYFHINVLENFIPIFAETSNDLCAKFGDTKEVNVTSFINDWVLATLHRTVLGISMTDDDYKNSPFRKGELIVPYRISRPWMLIDCIFSFTNSADKEKRQRTNLHEFTKRVLDAQRKQPASATSKFVSLIEVFMNISEANPEFTEQDVIDETCTFMLAGQDSVGAATAFTLHFLAKHEDVQKKVYEEQFRIFENDCRLVTTKDLSEMRYLEQCIKETMRLCPSVPIICRKLNEDVRLDLFFQENMSFQRKPTCLFLPSSLTDWNICIQNLRSTIQIDFQRKTHIIYTLMATYHSVLAQGIA